MGAREQLGVALLEAAIRAATRARALFAGV
jgi:hypothetical protein